MCMFLSFQVSSTNCVSIKVLPAGRRLEVNIRLFFSFFWQAWVCVVSVLQPSQQRMRAMCLLFVCVDRTWPESVVILQAVCLVLTDSWLNNVYWRTVGSLKCVLLTRAWPVRLTSCWRWVGCIEGALGQLTCNTAWPTRVYEGVLINTYPGQEGNKLQRPNSGFIQHTPHEAQHTS